VSVSCKPTTEILIELSVLGRALDYQTVIDDFVAKNKELRKYEMHSEDWDAITLVAQWLKAFRSATTQMSATKRSMLSSTHAIFRGLQESIQESIRALPNNVPNRLKIGLTKAHRKLSDYYSKMDDSPYYTWASRKSSTNHDLFLCFLNIPCQVLDPRISYEGLLSDCDNDRSAISLLNLFRDRLHSHYHSEYATSSSSMSASTQTAPPIPSGSPQKVDFTARYKKARVFIDELEEYFKLPQENFDTCDPIQWWAGRRAQFPNLSRLARDILSIPGKVVGFYL
jgi:hypothetical protein